MKKYTKNNVQSQGEKQMVKDFCTVSILKLTIFGFTHVKDICILDNLKNCLNEERDPQQPQFSQFKATNTWLYLYKNDFQKFK